MGRQRPGSSNDAQIIIFPTGQNEKQKGLGVKVRKLQGKYRNKGLICKKVSKTGDTTVLTREPGVTRM